MKRLVAVLSIAGAAFTFGAPMAAQADEGCTLATHVHANINGTPIDNDQCINPPAVP